MHIYSQLHLTHSVVRMRGVWRGVMGVRSVSTRVAATSTAPQRRSMSLYYPSMDHSAGGINMHGMGVCISWCVIEPCICAWSDTILYFVITDHLRHHYSLCTQE
jgi:hypothetical protein